MFDTQSAGVDHVPGWVIQTDQRGGFTRESLECPPLRKLSFQRRHPWLRRFIETRQERRMPIYYNPSEELMIYWNIQISLLGPFCHQERFIGCLNS